MAYTFWYSGILVGESNLEDSTGHARQLGGVFHPTPYGVEIFPRLTGILSAGHALKTYLDENGKSTDDMDADEIETLFNTHPAGQKIIDIGRTLSECEVRAPNGTLLEFESIGFSDLLEIEAFGRELSSGNSPEAAEAEPEAETEPATEPETVPDPPGDRPRYIVSATFTEHPSKGRSRAAGARARPWPKDN